MSYLNVAKSLGRERIFGLYCYLKEGVIQLSMLPLNVNHLVRLADP